MCESTCEHVQLANVFAEDLGLQFNAERAVTASLRIRIDELERTIEVLTEENIAFRKAINALTQNAKE